MELAPMRYKDYIWPHNPRVYSIEYRRNMSCQKVPFGRYHLQDLGLTRRVMRGEGEFFGPSAYDEFKKLATVFYRNGPGLLIHPVWQISNAYFVELSLAQEPRPDYVRYTFAFWEAFDGYDGRARAEREQTGQTGPEPELPGVTGTGHAAPEGLWHTVRRGDTLWGIARRYGTELSRVIGLNPGLKNPNLIHPGEKVRVR